jgi:iron complex transport system ATP-binding protein
MVTDGVVVKVEDISAGYAKRPVLDKVSFHINKGEMVGLIGPNGAGKSTLLKTMRGFLPLRTGLVEINGRKVQEFTAHDFACQVGYLQQYVEITFGYTTKEIVLAGRYPHLKWWQKENANDWEIVRACMEYTGVWDLADKTMHAISGGQRQRVLLAKVLAQQTPILFLDEPTTGLDVFYQEEIFRLCQNMCQVGKTVMMVVHELALAARFCSRILLVGKGGIIANGTADEVLTEKNLSRAYGVSVKVVKNPLTGNIEVFTVHADQDIAREQLLYRIAGVNTATNECQGGEQVV